MTLLRRLTALALVLALAACTPTPTNGEPSPSAEPSVSSAAPSPTEQAHAFPVESFAALGDAPVSDELAAELQAILETSANGTGLTATVISAQGTWSGATGLAAGDRAMVPNDQMSIAQITTSLVAAQVMQLVESGALRLDDLVADRLPPDIEFDTNGTTIADLMALRSGIPDVSQEVWDTQDTQPLLTFTWDELLASVSPDRRPVGETWEPSGINALLIGLIIEQATGQPIAEVLRSGVLAGDGYERLIFQPAEQPTEPMAMPAGTPADTFAERGSYLPSIGAVGSPEDSMASDAPTLARWFRNFCAGQIVSPASVRRMTASTLIGPPLFDGEDEMGHRYGLGVMDFPYGSQARAIGGMGGAALGYTTLALCFENPAAVVVVLANSGDYDPGPLAGLLWRAATN